MSGAGYQQPEIFFSHNFDRSSLKSLLLTFVESTRFPTEALCRNSLSEEEITSIMTSSKISATINLYNKFPISTLLPPTPEISSISVLNFYTGNGITSLVIKSARVKNLSCQQYEIFLVHP